MNNFEISNFRHIHFVGISENNMYLLAIYCKYCGLEVSASDKKESKYTNLCNSKGIMLYIGYKRKNVYGADLIVCSGERNNSNIEIIEANNRKINVIYAIDLLASICKKYKYVIGVAGSHGKTITCAMIYHVLRESGKKVSCCVGDDIENARLVPNDEYLVLECCEYNRKFLRLHYNIAVLLNIDDEHLDCYCNMYNLRNVFKTFLKRVKIENRFVFDVDSTSCIKNKVRRIKPAKLIGLNKFVYDNKKYVLDNVYGEYNVNNATVAVSVCENCGISYNKIYKALKTFRAVERRCEMLGKFRNFDILTDCAKHPTEIECLYRSLTFKYNKIYIIFQPYAYLRTRLLIKQFEGLLVSVKNLLIFKEYSTDENKDIKFCAKQLSKNVGAKYIKNYNVLKKEMFNITGDECGACVVFVGAGNVYQIAKQFMKEFGCEI